MLLKRIIAVLVATIMISAAAAGERKIKSVMAVQTETPVVDGKFGESEWSYGGLATGFTQREPKEGVPASEKTEVYFLYDKENLYVGVACYDSQPQKVMSELAGRDNTGASDFIALAFDTFHDHRNAYFFGTTPDGTKIDGRIFNDGQMDDSWDGVWYVETTRTDDGWTAEFRIPFNTFTFPRADVFQWGLNILRRIERNKEEAYWQEVTRDEGFRVSNFGHLENIQGIKPGMNLQFLPYLTSSAQQDRVTPMAIRNPNGFTGLDVRYGVTSNLTAVLTVNPDFAQIEADEDRINLSRYPYILREKRPFFLEGASIFNTAGNAMSDGEYRTALFYSRRINEPVYGLKTTGKVGNWDVGVLHALNDNDVGIQQRIDDEELPEGTKTRAYYNVVRMSKDIFSRSQVGLIAMSKEYADGYNRILGVDGRMRFKNNYTFSFEGVKSFTDRHGKTNHSLCLYFGHYRDFFKFSYWYQEQGPHFIGNEIGFYEYNNYRNTGFWMQLAPRFEKFGIRRMGNNLNAWVENYQDMNFFHTPSLSRGWNYNFWVQTMKYWMFGAGRSDGKYYDRFDEVLYPTLGYWVWIRNNWSSPFNFSLNHSQGKYRTGYRRSYNGSIRIKPSSRFNVQLNYNRSFVTHVMNDDTGEFEDRFYEIWRSKFYYHFTRNLNARLILQYNGMENRLDTYYLIAYNFKPGSFLYIAYTERFDSASYEDGSGAEIYPRFGSSNKVLQVKLSYLLQM
jgi:hypothetical protein